MTRLSTFASLTVVLLLTIRCADEQAPLFMDEALLNRVEPAVRASLEEGLGQVEGNPTAANWGELGDRLLSHGLEAQAADCYRRALSLNGDDDGRFEWQYLLGIATRSAREFEAATRLRPEHALSWLRLGLAEQSAVRHVAASDAFREATRLDPQLQRAHRGLGQSLMAMELASDAIEPLRRALELDRLDVASWTALAQAYSATDRIDQARDAAAQGRFARRAAGFDDPLWNRHVLDKGVSRSRRIERLQRAVAASHWADAEELIRLLRDERDDDADVEYLMAIVSANRGDFDAAARAFARCLEIQPDHLRAILSRAQLYERRGEFDRALESIDAAARISPRDPSIAMARMQNRRAAKDLKGLLGAIDQMLLINPGVGELEALREATANAIASSQSN